MYKQNLGFIAPFALNILAYVMIWHFFFNDKEITPQVDTTPVVHIEKAAPTYEEGVYTSGDDQTFAALKEDY